MMMTGRGHVKVKVNAASLLNALTIISAALRADLKTLATGLNEFSDAPAEHPLSPGLFRMYKAASFCGFWGVANYIGSLRELSIGIENNPPLSVDRTEYLERVKTLAAGFNALGHHLKEIVEGRVPWYTELNEQFGKVIRKARPSLLEVEPAVAEPALFMPAPPSLEADAEWVAKDDASHVSLCEAILAFLGSDEVTTQDLQAIAAANPYRSLSGLLETAACEAQACAVEPLATDLRREYSRILGGLEQGLPSVPPAPDAFVFSRLMHSLALSNDLSEESLALRSRYALARPRGAGLAVSMHDVARKFSTGMEKLERAYLQAGRAQTPSPVKTLAARVAADAGKLDSEAFTTFALALADHTASWSSDTELSFHEWTHGAALVLLLRETADTWSSTSVQAELLELAKSMATSKWITPSAVLQRQTRTEALQKSCTAILVEATELKMGIEESLRSFGDDELNDAQCARMVEVIDARARKHLMTVHGFCFCVGMPRGAAFALQLLELVTTPAVWQTAEDRLRVFDGLTRLSLFIGRLRPSSLIDIELDEMGVEVDPIAEEAIAVPATEAQALQPEVAPAADAAEPAAMADELEVVLVAEVEPIVTLPESTPAGSVLDLLGTYVTAQDPVVPFGEAAVDLEPRPVAEVRDLLETFVADIEPVVPFTGEEEGVAAAEAADSESLATESAQAPESVVAASDAGESLFGLGDLDADAGQEDLDAYGRPLPQVAPVAVDPQVLLEQFLAAGAPFEDKLDASDTELMNIMFEESEQCMGDVGEVVTAWLTDDDVERLVGTVAEARRHIHTLKGVARTCGLLKVGSILHAVEDNLDLMPDDGVSLRPSLSAYMGALTVVRDALDNARSVFEQSLVTPAAPAAEPEVEHVAELVAAPAEEQAVDSTPAAAVEAAVEDAAAPTAELEPVEALATAESTPESGESNAEPETVRAESELAADAVESAPVTEEAEAPAELAVEAPLATLESIEPAVEVAVEVAEPAVAVVAELAPAVLAAEPVAEVVVEQPAPAAVVEPVVVAPTAVRIEGSVRVPLKLASKVGAASGQVLMASRRSLEAVDGSLKTLRELESNIKRMGPVLRELDIMATASIASAAGGANTNGFDALELDRYTALQELVRRLKEAYEDSVGSATALTEGMSSVRGAEEERAQLSDDLQRESSELMLVSVATQRARLERVVAKACEDTGKQAALVIEPKCRVPAAALDKLMPVFEHLLRNAVAHGIESPAAREAAGKPALGVITIAPPRAGNADGSVVKVAVSDDGAGIDHRVVLGVAQKRGLAVRDRKYDDAAIRDFLFMPGFSTATSVSQLAGRGVGLDVVRSAVSALGGLVSVDSKAAQGTEFTLVLPTDITSMSVVPVTVRGYTCLLPLTLVQRVVPVSSSLDVVMNDADDTVSIAGAVYELVDLGARVPAVGDVRAPRGRGHLVLMRESDVTKAVLVDAIGAQSRMVVRQLGPFVRDVPGMVAGTVMADGEVGLVVNPLRLQELATEAAEKAADAPRTKHIMVVDDSSTVRLVTTRFLKRLGFEVSSARDGLDALQVLSRGVRPDGFIFDLEMPGMDGFDLISEIRRKCEYSDAPIVVISSRTAEKHRERARELGATAYLTKPYEDSQLQEVLESLLGLPA